MASKRKLTDKEEAFVLAYLTNGFNGAKAARTAGYSEGNARQQAHELLTKTYIRARIDKHFKEMAMDAKEVIARLTDTARSSIEDFVDESGHLSMAQGRESGSLHLLKSHTTTTRVLPKGGIETTEKFEMYSAYDAQVQLGRHHKLFTDKADITSDGKPLTIAVVKMDVSEL